MKLLAYPILTSCLLFTASAQLLLFAKPLNRYASEPQSPFLDPLRPAMPPSGADNTGDASAGDLLISDVMGTDSRMGIFSGFTRNIDSISSRLNSSAQNTTVLAPEDAAIRKLPRKPWEDPHDYETLGANAYAGQDGESRAQKNLRRFVEAHIVPESPWRDGQEMQTLAGNKVTCEEKDGKKMVSRRGDVKGSEC